MPSLIAPNARLPLIAVTAAAALVATVVGIVVWHGRDTSFDSWAFRQAQDHLSDGTGLTLLSFTSPAISITLLVVVAGAASYIRRWDVAALAVAGPAATVLLVEGILKPLVDRRLGPGVGVLRLDIVVPRVYPSGHEAVVASTICVLTIVLSRMPMRRRTRSAVFGLLALWMFAAALGLVRSFWHYATDTLGAICVSVAVVSWVALAIDGLAPRVRRRRLRRRTARQLELAVS